MSGQLKGWGWLLLVAAIAGCAHVHVRREAAETIAATAVAGFAAGSSQDQGHPGSR
jgi:hypothetical protein